MRKKSPLNDRTSVRDLICGLSLANWFHALFMREAKALARLNMRSLPESSLLTYAKVPTSNVLVQTYN